MKAPRILVAGIGNVFLGDDGFGVEVLQRLLAQMWPADVRVVDFGIRGFDLAFALLDAPEATLLIDALGRSGEPGTLYVLKPDLEHAEQNAGAIETHAMHPVRVLELVRRLGGEPANVFIIGCEPATFGPEGEGCMGLSEPVAAAVNEAVHVVERLIRDLLAGRCPGAAADTDADGLVIAK